MQNGYAVYDDVNDREDPGLEEFREPGRRRRASAHLVERYPVTEATAELADRVLAGV